LGLFAWGSRGVYSSWFGRQELANLFEKAGMPGASVLDDTALTVFPRYASYIDTDSQLYYKRRALIGVYANGVNSQLEADLVK
jgi:hypothetical protein